MQGLLGELVVKLPEAATVYFVIVLSPAAMVV
jgi:hypothetical protein